MYLILVLAWNWSLTARATDVIYDVMCGCAAVAGRRRQLGGRTVEITANQKHIPVWMSSTVWFKLSPRKVPRRLRTCVKCEFWWNGLGVSMILISINSITASVSV